MSDARWVVEVEIEGRAYRWGSTSFVAGDESVRGGLVSDLAIAEGDEDVQIVLLDSSVDWPALAAALEAAPCVVRRWNGEATLEAAPEYAAGLAQGVVSGTRYDEVAFTIAVPEGAPTTLGDPVPDVLARISTETWPKVGTLGADEGAWYPVLFGSPGDDGSATAVPCMPVPLAQWVGASAGSVAIVNQELGNKGTGTPVRVRNDNLDTETDVGLGGTTDLLGRVVQTVAINNPVRPITDSEAPKLYVGFKRPAGGKVRDAYSVCEYLLRRYAPETVDWARFSEVEGTLSVYQVDTWIDDALRDPWEWVEALLGDLPYQVRRTRRGRYLELLRFVPDGSRLVRRYTRGEGCERVGSRTRVGEGPFNQYTVRYRQRIDGEYLSRITVTGESAPGVQPIVRTILPVSMPQPTADEPIRHVLDARCARSRARFGLRVAPTIDLDWTWDTGTARAVLDWQIDRDSMPQWESTYDIRGGHELRTGDEVEITDDELGLTDEPMLVAAPPVADETPWARVLVRYAAE